VIDYACGAGHFLTEAVEAINAARPDSDNSWVETHIYGIEKDYRGFTVALIPRPLCDVAPFFPPIADQTQFNRGKLTLSAFPFVG